MCRPETSAIIYQSALRQNPEKYLIYTVVEACNHAPYICNHTDAQIITEKFIPWSIGGPKKLNN